MGHASKLFNGNTDQTLIGRVTPTLEQRDFLRQQWNDLADHLKQALAKHGYIISTWLQGSYKYATLIKPVHAGEEYDVDVGLYFQWDDDQDAEPTPKQLRDWVQAELLEYEAACEELEHVEVPPKERCSRASYIQQFHIDTPVYHLNTDSDVRRLACLSGKWEHSDPKKLYKWFKEAVSGEDRDQLRRLVRYLKAWAAVSFDDVPDSRPTSIFLTVVTTDAYQDLWMQRVFGLDDDDALLAVIKKLHDRLFDDRKVENPVDKNEDLNRMSAEAWDACPGWPRCSTSPSALATSKMRHRPRLSGRRRSRSSCRFPKPTKWRWSMKAPAEQSCSCRKLKSRFSPGPRVVSWQRIAMRCQALQRTAHSHSPLSTHMWCRSSRRSSGQSAMRAQRLTSGAIWDTDALECACSALRSTPLMWDGTSWIALFASMGRFTLCGACRSASVTFSIWHATLRGLPTPSSEVSSGGAGDIRLQRPEV